MQDETVFFNVMISAKRITPEHPLWAKRWHKTKKWCGDKNDIEILILQPYKATMNKWRYIPLYHFICSSEKSGLGYGKFPHYIGFVRENHWVKQMQTGIWQRQNKRSGRQTHLQKTLALEGRQVWLEQFPQGNGCLDARCLEASSLSGFLSI